MISQGAGGGYGDVLERDPYAVVRDVELNRITDKVAREIFAVAYDPSMFVLDVEGTKELRSQARKTRLERGKPYAEFVKEFVTPEPPKELLYYGSWGDDTDELTATVFDINGPKRVTAPISQVPIVMLPDRRDLKVAALEARIRKLEETHGEDVHRKS
jgi:acetone carboxylase alpha subunit